MPLTERAGRGLVLTTAGHALAQTAQDVAVALQRAEAVVGGVRRAAARRGLGDLLPDRRRDAAARAS